MKIKYQYENRHEDPAYIRWKERMKKERPYAKFPCKGCLTLAICKGKSEYIECPLLYTWMRTGIYYHGVRTQKIRYRIRKLEKMFNRSFHAHGVTNTIKPSLIFWWNTHDENGNELN